MIALDLVQRAVVDLLTSDETLMGMVTGVLDHVSDSQATPYVSVGPATEVPFDTHTSRGAEHTITLSTWSSELGFLEAQQIAARIDSLMHQQHFDVPGAHLVWCAREFSQPLRDTRQPALRHLPVRFRVVIQEAVTP